jgi:hypothetical protein
MEKTASSIRRFWRKKCLRSNNACRIWVYWTGPIDGVFDPASRHALVAFQKVEGRARTGQPTRSELEALRRAAKPFPKHSGYPHVEIDIGRQVLFVVSADDSITHILPVCTGNEQIYLDHSFV